MALDLIYDRAQSDVAKAEALIAALEKAWGNVSAETKAQWQAGGKGFYNYTDLNRVGEAVAYLRDALTASGIGVSVSPKTDWTDGDIPSSTQLAAYLADIRTLRNALSAPSDLPAVPDSMDYLTYSEANDIERILCEVNELLEMMLAVINQGWSIGIAHTGLYFGTATPVLNIVTEDGQYIELEDGGHLEMGTLPGLPEITQDITDGYFLVARDGKSLKSEVSLWQQ